MPCPSASDPGRNSHRTGATWTLRTVAAILANPRYTGRQVWNRQRTDFDLVDPVSTSLGHRQVQRWNLPECWVISKHPAHGALVSEAGFIKAQNITAPRGPAAPAARRYLLAGLLTCGRCGRRLESAWSNGKPAYRCRHGHTSATSPDPARPKTTYVREDQVLPPLAAIAILLDAPALTPVRQSRGLAQVTGPDGMAVLIERLRADSAPTTRTTGPCAPAVTTRCPSPPARTTDERAREGRAAQGEETREITRCGRRLSKGDNRPCPRTAAHGDLTCPRAESQTVYMPALTSDLDLGVDPDPH